MAYTLATAAEVAKVSKPTVFRWIKTGKITAAKTDAGEYRIDPAELQRYLDSVRETPPPGTVKQPEALSETAVGPLEALPEVVALRSEVDKLKALLEMERTRVEEWKAVADRWALQAERLALPSPETRRNGWWPFRRAG
jgi:excisionase family DNA binding protein